MTYTRLTSKVGDPSFAHHPPYTYSYLDRTTITKGCVYLKGIVVEGTVDWFIATSKLCILINSLDTNICILITVRLADSIAEPGDFALIIHIYEWQW